MNVDQWLILIAILACFVVSWFFSSAETVFTSLPMYKFDAIFKNKSTPFYRVIALMIKKYQLTLSAILIGNNFINVLCPLLVSIFVGQIWKIDENLEFIIISIGLTMIMLCFCDFFPKTFAKKHQILWLKIFGFIIFAFFILFFPLSYLLNFIFSGRKKTEIFTVSENELSVIATNAHKEGVLEISELNRVKNALAFDDTYIEKIMSSEDLESINIKNKTNRKIYDELCDTHHSRIIAYNGNKIIGYIKIRDLFKKIYMGDKFKIKDVIRPLTFVKNTMLISDVTKILIETSVSVFAVLDSKTNKTIGFITSDHIFSYLLGHPLRTETPKKKRK